MHGAWDNYFSAKTYDNDIALIKITPKDGRGIMAGMYVQPACLPSDNTPYTEDLDCYISGWGATSLGGYHFFSSMKYLEFLFETLKSGNVSFSYMYKTRI